MSGPFLFRNRPYTVWNRDYSERGWGRAYLSLTISDSGADKDTSIAPLTTTLCDFLNTTYYYPAASAMCFFPLDSVNDLLSL